VHWIHEITTSQLWDLGNQYVRIVVLERLAVDYRIIHNLETNEGTHHHPTKKEFCALVKNAKLVMTPKALTKTESKRLF
jgi:hypothetical protein